MKAGLVQRLDRSGCSLFDSVGDREDPSCRAVNCDKHDGLAVRPQPLSLFGEDVHGDVQLLHHGEIAERNVVSVDAAVHTLAGDRLEVFG